MEKNGLVFLLGLAKGAHCDWFVGRLLLLSGLVMVMNAMVTVWVMVIALG